MLRPLQAGAHRVLYDLQPVPTVLQVPTENHSMIFCAFCYQPKPGLELGRLRHLYQQMLIGNVQNTAKAAHAVLVPVIALLENIAPAMDGQMPPST